jgi:hypothetical protein
VVDHSAVRCPAADPALLAKLRHRVAAPAATGQGVSRGQMLAKVDELRIDADGKGRAGLLLAAELERCRGAAAKSDEKPAS